MSSFPGRGPPPLHTHSSSAASHHTETCNVVIFGETGAGKSSLINLIAGTQVALTSCDAVGCTTESNVYDVSIQNKTLQVKLFDTVGLGEGPEGKVSDKDARRFLKKLLRDLMKQTEIHLLMYCVRGVRVTKALCRNYNLIRSEVKEKVPIVLVATNLEDKGPEMEEWWRDNERSISNFGMTFAGHACITTATINKYARDTLKQRHKQSYHAVCQLIEQCRLLGRVHSDTPRTHILSTLISRKRHKDNVLAGETASAGSLVDHMLAEEVVSTAPDLRLWTLQHTETVDLYDEISKAFETIRLEDPHLEIKEYSIVPETGGRNDDKSITLAAETATSVGSHTNPTAGDEVAPIAPDTQSCMSQCSETTDSDEETPEAIETIRLEELHIGTKEYPITLDISNSRHNDPILAGETGSPINLVVGGRVVSTAPDIGCRILHRSEIVDSDDETSEPFEPIRLEDPHLRIREPTLTSRNNGILLVEKTAARSSSLVNIIRRDGVVRTTPDVRRHLLQLPETVNLDSKTSRAFLCLVDPHPRIRGYTTIGTRNKISSLTFFHRLEDLYMGIIAFPDPPNMDARNKHTIMVLFRKTGVGKSSLLNILAGEKVVSTDPDMRRRRLQCTEFFDLDHGTSVETIRLEDLHLDVAECLTIPPKMGAREHKFIAFVWQTGAGNRSLINLTKGEEVASTPNMRPRIQYLETVDLDDKNSKMFSRLEDLHLSIKGYHIPPKVGAKNEHEVIVLCRQTGTGKRSLVNLMTRKEAASTGLDICHHMLQCSETVSLNAEISKAFLRPEDPYLRIRGYPIPPKPVLSMVKHMNIVLSGQSVAAQSSLVNPMSRAEVAPTAPNIRSRMLQYPETVNLDDKTSEVFLHPEDPRPRIREYPIPPKTGARRSKHQSIVLFGDTGAGKSSLINLIAGEKVAHTSPDMQRCTMHWQEYKISFGDTSYKVFDTVGLEAPQLGIKEYLDFVENAYQLIKQLDKQGGIDLLLFCVRAGRITATLQSNYRLFYEFLCERKVPIVLAITNLEREERMEDWWERNEGAFDNYQIKVAGHACITAANRLDGRHKNLYEESRVTIRNLVEKFTADEQKQAWLGGDNLFVSLTRKLKGLLKGSSRVRRKDLVTHLTKRCGISREVAKQLADMIKHDVEAT